ncbi:MAG: polysaccharide biosynthesis tyrosine autokinase [Burkholderiaceae bacterium]|nr:polysaccharide biosynthesis tyrosine autokinase [Burkholderiaceae bacterium]
MRRIENPTLGEERTESTLAPPVEVDLIPGVVAKVQGTRAHRSLFNSHDDSVAPERLIGAILSTKVELGPDQVERILTYARENGVRFGDAAVALKLVSQDQVLQALAEQFGYAYASEERRKQMPELVGLNQPFSLQAEAIREIRSQVMMRVFKSKPRPALAIVSPSSGDGKTFFSANLAVALAQVGGRTLIVDADLRGPRQHEVFKVDNTTGLSSVLAGHVDSKVIQQVPETANLFIMPVGVTPPNPLELIERPAFGILLRELTSKFDHVIVDTPAAMYGVDAQVVAARCGAALVVARKNSSKVGALQKLVSALSDSTARMAGVIMNEY